MDLKQLLLGFGLSIVAAQLIAAPTELDQYLQKKQILDSHYKIQSSQALNDVLDVLSDEDSRTLPFQVDQNMLMEKYQMNAQQIDIEGIITTPDFSQFEQSIGTAEVKKLMKKNTLQNCHLLFENQFQRSNPYAVNMKLASEKQVYQYSIKNTECAF